MARTQRRQGKMIYNLVGRLTLKKDQLLFLGKRNK
jgi:hypothetical protein